ncbi:hypothetical protein GGG17_02025 [Arsenicicoccus sp. MKL-02]|uniref:Integral membrane bound transporter domain-containing protein n=1 Tax=Arsenicicoccus cauae TaxID=2663847 RepID=A0A6I3I3M3_9MICO|nr:FUSC family protein [Arsenicicoccus cauae]MTB70774.1 hypothetical protein [Arsenicicoccus cauae]
MSSPSLRRHARSLLRLNPSPPRWPVAVKAAVAMAVPLSVGQLAGHLSLGLVASLGVFTILYAATAPGRFRARVMALAALGLTASVGLGALTAGHPVVTVAVLVVVAMVAAFVCVALKVGPPGSYFFVLVLGVGNLAVTHGANPWSVVALTFAGAVSAWVIGMADLLVAPHRAERRATEAAEGAIRAFAAGADQAPAGEGADGELAALRAGASGALHRAWTAVTDGGRPPQLVERLERAQLTYAAASATLAGVRLGVGPLPWGSVDDEAASDDVGPGEQDSPVDGSVDAEQLRDTALGRPGAGYLLREAARWPSEVLLLVLRVGLATALAGLVAGLLHQGHVHWAVCCAALVLHQGGTREVQTVRGVHRTLGTLVGLVIYAGLLALAPQGWWLVLVVAALQLLVELLVTRNYALAVVVITPLALTIGMASAPGEPVSSVVADRLVDTLVGVACALLVLWTTGRRAPEVVLRAHARRVVVATERVMVDLAAGALETRAALAHRRHLYYELLESEVVARRALADSHAAVAPYHRVERSLAALGYLVLGACWHPDIRRAHAAFDRARGPLERIMAEPVTRPRPAEAIERDVREVEELVLSLR